MLTLKLSAKLAYHTTRRLVMNSVPRLPCSLLRFHTPLTRLHTWRVKGARMAEGWRVLQAVVTQCLGPDDASAALEAALNPPWPKGTTLLGPEEEGPAVSQR